ncbi:hypothetical protein ACQEU8_06935 [Streptomyces sp. CA-250714]|uniref:hypothetical protein n=1 Tax=Streptomyces sp. CA-250714 TaxID=3240060 RepID=UPI003D8CE3B5
MALLAALAAGACADNGSADASARVGKPAKVDPADFVKKIDNPYLPLAPGTKLHYKGVTKDGPQEDLVEVTHRTKKILGVRTVVVRDTATERGKVVEVTDDWYAQDRKGNVWYFGEDSKTIKNGKVTSTEGSWEAGRKGARPGIVMKAHPKPGDKYRQEHAKGVAEDRAEVLSTDARVSVPYGTFRDVLKTKDDSPLEPELVENKFYAKGVGSVREVAVKGEKDELELVKVDKPRPHSPQR